jgi:hypothetical protein
MGIKAQPSQANPGSRHAPVNEGRPAQPLGLEDTLVMVIFPKATWDEVVRLAGEMNVAPAEAMGAALLLLRARVDEEAGHVR